jgi:hypothetical protein
MLMGRYVTYMDQMNAKGIWDDLFAGDDLNVSIELGDYGGYDGAEHVKQFLYSYHDYLQDPSDKRGWMDIRNINTPYIIISNDGERAYATWHCFSPQAKQAKPYPSDERTLTALWVASRLVVWCVRVGDAWKFQKIQEVVYIRTPYELGWLKQPDCMRLSPLSESLPDRPPRVYAYHPDAIYSPTGLYNWGPFPPEEGSF